jgi:iron complex transport system substrate-binding protein
MKQTYRLLAFITLLALLIGMGGVVPVTLAQTAEPTLAATESNVYPRTVKDGSGSDVTIEAKPMHIVSVSLASDEVLLAIVDHERITAVTSNALDEAQSNVAEIAKTIPNQLAKADPEAIIALEPDLVIISVFTDAGVVKQLKEAGLTVFILSTFSSIKDIESNILLLGEVVGEENDAAELVNWMETKLATIADAVKDVEPITTVYYAPDGYSVGVSTTIDEVITRAGGENIVTKGEIKDAFPQLSDEFMVTQDPDVVLLAGFNSYAPGFVEKFNTNPAFQTLKAIKDKKVYIVNDAHVASVSQYIVEGVSDVAALLYPDAYQPEVEATETTEVTMEATVAQ